MTEAPRDREVGFIVEATQYVLTLEGFPSARVGDLIVHEGGSERALVRSLAEDTLVALALDPFIPRAGDRFSYLPEQRILPVGEHLFGRVMTPIGDVADAGEPLPSGTMRLALDEEAPGIEVRAPIQEQLETGITLVDTLLPIAKGQRQLLFGPVKGGKTDFLVDVVRNQEHTDTLCIYALIGKSFSELERIEHALFSGAHDKTFILAALSDRPAPTIALAPTVALHIADSFARAGRDVLVVLDDLDLHAKYLREIALLENRLPGRESYPGDLFYEHAHVLERAGRFSPAYGGGSITVLPVIETDPYETLGIVSTNLMACTDGHLAFAAPLQSEGIYPAIAEEQSITRIGRATQGLLSRQLSRQLRILLAEARRKRQYAQFGAAVGSEVAKAIHQGEVIEAMLRQMPGERVALAHQVPLLALTLTSIFDGHDSAFVRRNKPALIKAFVERPELADLVKHAQSDTPLEKYLPLVEREQALFTSLCRA